MSFTLPTETIELPSKGLIYPSDNPLSSGTVEIKYMTAKEEDILTNQNYIANGSVLDKLLKSLIVSDINYNDLLIGDKNAIMVSARILGYGAEYRFNYDNVEEVVDLSKLENKVLDESLYTKGLNEFQFTLPTSGNEISFKLLTHGDEIKVTQELEGLKKINKEGSPELTTRLKYMITSINGDRERKTIREFVDTAFLARDARAFREYIQKIQPDVDLTFFPSGTTKHLPLPIGISFFGLTSTLAKQYRVNFLTQIHEICFYGQGGYSWNDVYNMPLWLRKFTYQKIKEHYDKQSEQVSESKKPSNTNNLIGKDGKISTPKFGNKTSYK